MQTDGGQRVPFVAAWPGMIPAGQVFDENVWTLDASVTILTAAGAHVDSNMDGADLMPWLRGTRRGRCTMRSTGDGARNAPFLRAIGNFCASARTGAISSM
jgi:arylsulfatase A-like enzyme